LTRVYSLTKAQCCLMLRVYTNIQYIALWIMSYCQVLCRMQKTRTKGTQCRCFIYKFNLQK